MCSNILSWDRFGNSRPTYQVREKSKDMQTVESAVWNPLQDSMAADLVL